MARIAPFQPYRYTAAAGELRDVVTQPYDKISPEMQAAYLAASPYNLVRVILGQAQAGDSATDNVYTRAAGYLEAWIQAGVLARDTAPASAACPRRPAAVSSWSSCSTRHRSASAHRRRRAAPSVRGRAAAAARLRRHRVGPAPTDRAAAAAKAPCHKRPTHRRAPRRRSARVSQGSASCRRQRPSSLLTDSCTADLPAHTRRGTRAVSSSMRPRQHRSHACRRLPSSRSPSHNRH